MQQSQNHKQPFKPHFLIKSFIAYIYFIQGFYLSLGGTIVLLYPQYPSPTVLSHFSIAFLPFSFKYITAPLVQKFTFIKYGRRKFGIVVSLFATTLLTYPLIQNLTNPKQHWQVVIALFIILLFISMGDISLDAASVKELENPVLSGYLQMFYQSLGNIAGGLVMMKFVTPSNWFLFATKKPICSAQTFTVFIGVMNGVVGLLLHFFYKQRVIKSQEEETTPSFKRIFKFYLHFLKPKYKLCRFGIYLLIFNQGLKFFKIGFQPQAIYRGFDKQILPQIHTICIFIALVVNSIVSRFITEQNMWTIVRIVYFSQFTVMTIIFVIGSFSKVVVIGTVIILQILNLIVFLINSSKLNTFGQSALAGVCITTLASLSNFGNNSWIQLKIISIVGYQTSVAFGLALALVIGIFSKNIIDWVERGEPEQNQLHIVPEEQKYD